MQRLLFILVLLSGLTLYGRAQSSLYDQKFKSLEGQEVLLSAYKGKKLLVIVLPLVDSAQQQLVDFAATYKDQITVIGVPAIEEGIQKAEVKKLQQFYIGKRLPVLLTERMKVKKSADSAQAGLMQWLTKKENNRHFDQDVIGGGHKFFVDEQGELYAVLGPPTPLNHPVVEKIVNKPIILKN